MYNSDSDDENLLLLLTLIKRKRLWVHKKNTRREDCGEYHRLCLELQTFEDRYFTYFRMSKGSFEDLHEMLRSHITKSNTNLRRAISTRERLAICLRYLSSRDSFQSISFSFCVGRSTVSLIVQQVCKAIWEVLQPTYIPSPTKKIWKQSESGYREVWGFPNCLGSIEGRHVKIESPSNSGSHDSQFSIVLLAIVDPYYNFLYVDIGNYGEQNGIFENSNLFKNVIAKREMLPPKPLPMTSDPVPHVLLGDEGFALKPYLMRPFPRNSVLNDEGKKKFNYSLCRARSVVENAFGILTEKWGIFHKPIECKVETAIYVMQAACCLHNFVHLKDGRTEPTSTSKPQKTLTPIRRTNQRSTNAALDVREKFATYFSNNQLQSSL